MGLFGKKSPPLPNYLPMSLETLLEDPVWSGPIRDAGFEPARSELTMKAGDVMVTGAAAARNGRPAITAYPAVVLVQGAMIGLAFPQEHEVVVLKRSLSEALLMLTQRGAVQASNHTPVKQIPFGRVVVRRSMGARDRADWERGDSTRTSGCTRFSAH